LASKQHTELNPQALRNTNPLLATKPELVDTSKTGFIRAAGKCVVSRLMVNGRRYLVVMLQSPSTLGLMRDYATLYTWLGGTDTIYVPQVKIARAFKVNKKSRKRR
jgi:D-alanyl-D-alanine carboxypeptidase